VLNSNVKHLKDEVFVYPKGVIGRKPQLK